MHFLQKKVIIAQNISDCLDNGRKPSQVISVDSYIILENRSKLYGNRCFHCEMALDGGFLWISTVPLRSISWTHRSVGALLKSGERGDESQFVRQVRIHTSCKFNATATQGIEERPARTWVLNDTWPNNEHKMK